MRTGTEEPKLIWKLTGCCFFGFIGVLSADLNKASIRLTVITPAGGELEQHMQESSSKIIREDVLLGKKISFRISSRTLSRVS
uniref:Uncharacterized protein n=1 Tax=Setaria viridis TaxID=4556 RepID=A0A4U6TYH2_SETVI|nr:hypothetical protein SEVIR_7G258100v2 [Setaria viridis]